MTRLTWIMLGMLLMPLGASANDSSARVGAGGLVLEKSDDIEMVSEVLEISTEKIRVTYHFLNTSSRDIKTVVAFPMPAFYQADRDNIGPLDTFRMSVNGKNVAARKNRKFLIGDADVTDKLRQLGLTDDQIFNTNFECWEMQADNPCSLTQKQVAAVDDLGKRVNGLWQIQETAYWEQVFPAGKDIEVVHEYRPFTGFHYGGHQYDDPESDCLDDGTRKAIAKRDEQYDRTTPTTRDVEYILGTGRNWKGPIKHFKLIVRKDSPEDVVSLCFPGKAKKASPVTIEFSRTDYVPQDKLVVYFN